MPVSIRSGGGSRRGTGFTLGPQQNTFGDSTTADQAAAEALRDTYTTANADWLALYNTNRSNFIQLIWNGGDLLQRRNVGGTAWEDGTNVIIGPVGPAGTNGNDGAPGGGAFESLGLFDTAITNANEDQFLALGFDWPDDTDWVSIIPISHGAGTNAGTGFLFHLPRLGSIDPSTVGTASTAATRVQMNDQGITGAVYLGKTAAGGALIEFSETQATVAVAFYKYVPSAMQTRRSDSEIDQLIAAYTGGIPGLTIPDTQLPASIMRDSEFTAAAVRGLLNLTEIEVNNLFVGHQITAGMVTITLNDGSDFTFNTGSGGMADGVIDGASIVGTELTLTRTIGNPVTFDLAPFLDARFLNQADNLSDIPAPATALTNLGGLNQDGVRAQATGSFQFVTAFPANPYGGQKVMFTAAATGLADAVDESGTAITEASAGDAFEYDATDTQWERRIRLGVQAPPVGTHTRYAAFSPDNMFSEAEWLAGNTATGEQITFPVTAAAHYKGFAIPATEASLTVIQQVGNAFNSRDSYTPAVGAADVLQDIDGVSHKVYIGVGQDFPGAAEDFILR